MHYSTISGVSDNEKLALFLVLLLNFYVTISPISKIGLFIERKENGMAETRKLYYENGACLQFCATVLSCVPTDGNFAVTLDATAFYPEGGGQPADRGALGGARVLDVHEKDGVVVHTVTAPLRVGEMVQGDVDGRRRLDHSQQQTGEHIVSGLLHEYVRLTNVGFHLGSEAVTMDFDGVITREQLRMIEHKANEAVAKNLPVKITWPSREELMEIPYRSKKEIDGPIRIVEIPGYDICACCAPHVHFTGEIGMIRLTGMEKYKGGVRIQMLCGFRALADALEKEHNVYDISAQLSAKPYEVAAAVEKLKNENLALKQEMTGMKMDILQEKITALPENEQNICFFDKHMDKSNMRYAFNLLVEKCSGLCGCFDGDDENGYRYVMGGRDVDVIAAGKAMNEALDGRGGGSKEMFQGSLKAAREQIEKYFANL